MSGFVKMFSHINKHFPIDRSLRSHEQKELFSLQKCRYAWAGNERLPHPTTTTTHTHSSKMSVNANTHRAQDGRRSQRLKNSTFTQSSPDLRRKIKACSNFGSISAALVVFCWFTDKARTLTTTSSSPCVAQPLAPIPPSIYSCHSSSSSCSNKYTRLIEQSLCKGRQVYKILKEQTGKRTNGFWSPEWMIIRGDCNLHCEDTSTAAEEVKKYLED